MNVLRLGEVTISRVTEVERWPFRPEELFPAITGEIVERAARELGPRFVDPDTGELILSITCHIVRAAGTVIVVDSGNGNFKHRPALLAHHRFDTPYLERLTEAGVDPGEVDVVVSTHLHPDHCGWNTRLLQGRWTPTFPNATYLFDRGEFEWLRALFHDDPDDPVAADLARTFADSVEPVVRAEQAVLVGQDHVIVDEGGTRVSLRGMPGHTGGHLVVDVRGGGRHALLSGDVIHHPLQLAVPDLAQGGDQDPARAARTRRALMEECAAGGTLVLPAHFPGPPGRIVRDGGRFSFDPLPDRPRPR
ncbi:MBL fold metallo-hydrolase [Streptosporangium longisporum]|uniref:MBL fold metallo-hydrolase n=1 Tax=Streptosporangium longisporum TaxID=46187 RepID=A0ABN3XSY9_9ACTN